MSLCDSAPYENSISYGALSYGFIGYLRYL
jgi:hypothetical protein